MTPLESIIEKTVRRVLIEFFTSKSITQVEAAEILGVSKMTVHRMIKDGRIKKNNQNKIDREEIVKVNGKL